MSASHSPFVLSEVEGSAELVEASFASAQRKASTSLSPNGKIAECEA